MKIKIFGKEMPFLLFFSLLLGLLIVLVLTLLYWLHVSYMNIFFGSFSILLVIVLYYYWINSKGFYNNLGRIRRTFYTLYLILMCIGFMTGKVDYKDWKLLLEITALVVFVDLAVFQNPNILKIWNTEFKHEDEVRETLKESKLTILKNAKKVENFSQVIQYTDVHFDNRSIPVGINEYKSQLEEYLRLYSDTFGFAISFFLFSSPTNEDDKKQSIETQLRNISIRHAFQFSTDEKDKDKLIISLSSGESLPIIEDQLIAIPYFGDLYSMIITIEAKDVPVDVIDASHISNLVYIFDWYMSDSEDDET